MEKAGRDSSYPWRHEKPPANPQTLRNITNMTTRTTIAASILVLATAVTGAASANISTGSIGIDVQSAVSSGHVSVFVKNGVATLVGVVESRVDSNAAARAASDFSGITSVDNRINVSN